jgi:hypothetical protein
MRNDYDIGHGYTLSLRYELSPGGQAVVGGVVRGHDLIVEYPRTVKDSGYLMRWALAVRDEHRAVAR